MVFGVAGQDQRLAPLPGLQPKWAVGHDLTHLGPGLALCLHHVPEHGVTDGVRQQLKEVGGGLFQLHHQGQFVESPHPHVIPPSLPPMEGPGPLDVVQQEGVGRSAGRIQDPLPGVLEVPRRHRHSVAPAHVVPQVEEVPAPTFRYLPTAGHVGHDVHLRALLYQPAEELLYHSP